MTKKELAVLKEFCEQHTKRERAAFAAWQSAEGIEEQINALYDWRTESIKKWFLYDLLTA